MTRHGSPAVVLRPGALADIDDVIRIIQSIWVDSYDELTGRRLPAHRWLEVLADARFTFVSGIGAATIACRDGKTVGWTLCERAYIDDLWVDPPHQGHGVGKLLLDHTLSRIG